jgi:hypothetical protein
VLFSRELDLLGQILTTLEQVPASESSFGYRVKKSNYLLLLHVLWNLRTRAEDSIRLSGESLPRIPSWANDGDILDFYNENDFELLGVCFRAEVENFMVLLDKSFDFVGNKPRDSHVVHAAAGFTKLNASTPTSNLVSSSPESAGRATKSESTNQSKSTNNPLNRNMGHASEKNHHFHHQARDNLAPVTSICRPSSSSVNNGPPARENTIPRTRHGSLASPISTSNFIPLSGTSNNHSDAVQRSRQSGNNYHSHSLPLSHPTQLRNQRHSFPVDAKIQSRAVNARRTAPTADGLRPVTRQEDSISSSVSGYPQRPPQISRHEHHTLSFPWYPSSSYNNTFSPIGPIFQGRTANQFTADAVYDDSSDSDSSDSTQDRAEDLHGWSGTDSETAQSDRYSSYETSETELASDNYESDTQDLGVDSDNSETGTTKSDSGHDYHSDLGHDYHSDSGHDYYSDSGHFQ